MELGKNDVPVLKCTVIHNIPGRIRIGCNALQYLSEYNSDMKRKIEDGMGIHSVKISNITSNILIYYDKDLQFTDLLVEHIDDIIAQYSINAYQNSLNKKDTKLNHERKLHEHSVSEVLMDLGLVSSLFLYTIFKRPIVRVGLFGRLLNFPALGALALALPLFRSGFRSLKENKRPNADALEAMALTSSILSGRYISSLTILLLHNSAELLTVYAMQRTKNAIREMLSVQGDAIWKIMVDGTIVKVDISKVSSGDHVVFHTGEKICVDGVIISGSASVDQSAITGEFMPASKNIDDEVFAGTIVKSGTITIKTLAVGDKTAVARIIDIVENAPAKKAAMQNYADKVSEVLIPINLLLFGAVFFVTKDIGRALNMLVIDYSCGIKLSTATAFSAAITTAARNNVLVKGSNIIEELSEADTLILDKTGTLTRGKPVVLSIIPVNNEFSHLDVIEYAASAEETSIHPVATAILNKLRVLGGNIKKHGEIIVTIGKGIHTEVDGEIIRVGSKRFMNENQIHTHPLEDQVRRLSLAGENVVFISKGKLIIGVLGIRDPLRDNMRKALNRLRFDAKIDDMILLTGDLEQQAEVVSNRLGMDRYDYELMPEDKAKSVLQLKAEGCKVVMVGDGINDAPALAYSDVGIAMGSSITDIAMQTADITIAGDTPLMLPSLFSLSKSTIKIVKQNFMASIGINTLGLLLGGTGVISVFGGALLHNSSTVLVVGNSLRILLIDMNKRKI